MQEMGCTCVPMQKQIGGFFFALGGASNKTAMTITMTKMPPTIDKMTPMPIPPDVVAVAGVGDGCGAAVGEGVSTGELAVGEGVGAGVLALGSGVSARVGAGVLAEGDGALAEGDSMLATGNGVGASGGSNIPLSELLLEEALSVPLALA